MRDVVFERFSESARRTVALAQEEAELLGHRYIGTEHLLLGLARLDEDVARKALDALGASHQVLVRRVEKMIGPVERAFGSRPFSPRAKKVLKGARREASLLGHGYVGAEHLLLSLAREDQGTASQVLSELGIKLVTVRRSVLDLLSPEHVAQEGSGLAAIGPRCPSCGEPLHDTARYRELAVVPDARHAGSPRLNVNVVYCQRCGRVIGC